MKALALVMQISINMIVPIFVCSLVGVFITNKTGKTWVFIVAFIIGVVAGINGCYRLLKDYLKDEKSPGQIQREIDENNSK